MGEFNHLLEENEKIVIQTKPKFGTYLVRVFIMLIFMAVPIVCFYINELTKDIAIIYVIFMLILIFLIGCVGWLKYKSYLYCITDKKVIIRSGIIGRDFRVLALESITTIDIKIGLSDKLCGNKTASLVFLNASNSTFRSSENETGYNKNAFLHIENANAVYKQVKELIKTQRKEK